MIAVFERRDQTFEIEYGELLLAKIREHTGLEEVTEQDVRDFLVEALRNAIDKAASERLDPPGTD